MRDTDQDWAHIAATSPYWGILSVPEYQGNEISPEMQEKFFASGEVAVEAIFHEIRKIWPSFSPVRSLDFGCGVGRLLFPMAKRSQHAVGVDVAPNMLAMAEAASRRFGIENVELKTSDDKLSQVTGTFDFVHSFIVMQHIPTSRGYRYFRRLLELLQNGGVFAIHFNFAKRRDLMQHELPMAKYYRREGHVLYDLVETHEHPTGTVTMYDYDLNELFAIANEFTNKPISTQITAGDHLGIYIIGQRTQP